VSCCRRAHFLLMYQYTVEFTVPYIKGTVSRDFRPSVFVIKTSVLGS
jgi:hypothetical protein